MTIKRGDIYYADLSPVVGSEQGGMRPVLIVQNDIGSSKYADELKKENLLKASEHFGVSVDDLATAPQGEIMSTTAVNVAGS